ncbi:MAG: hypothetical protein P8074_15385 [Anaerolineales bacterium]
MIQIVCQQLAHGKTAGSRPRRNQGDEQPLAQANGSRPGLFAAVDSQSPPFIAGLVSLRQQVNIGACCNRRVRSDPEKDALGIRTPDDRPC